MLSKFFIDRPVFATVLSVIITLAGTIALIYLPIAQYPRITPPSVSVSISYPGASAQIVADTVAAPIEQSVTGVPGMLYMSSQMGNDGSYSLSVTFDVNVDLNTALVMVQTRVKEAMPQLPTPVQNQGITIRKRTPDILCMVNFASAVHVTTKDGKKITGIIFGNDEEKMILRDVNGQQHVIPNPKANVLSQSPPIFDDLFLSNYALIHVRDELLRVEGVSDINIFGERDYSIRVWLDPEKLAARSMMAVDVADAVRTHNLPAPIGQLGQRPASPFQAFQLPLVTLGRLTEPEQFGDIVVKAAQMTPSVAGPPPIPTGIIGKPISLPVPLSPSPITPMPITPPSTTSTSTSDGTSTTGTSAPGAPSTSMAGLSAIGTSSPFNPSGGSSGSGSTGGVPLFSTAKRPKMAKLAGASTTPAKKSVAPPAPSVAMTRLRDVARVEMGAFNYNLSCTFDGGPSVGLSIYQLPGTNALDVADRVRAKMNELKKRFPDGVDFTIAYDTAPFIRESIGEVFNTLRDAVILVAIVVLFFLQDWRAMILPMIDVPVSLIGTFVVMAAMGYSLNNISLFGLVLAIGIVVDDAIVVLENIERQMAKGYDTRTATIKAMEEISGPILAITLVLCAVFVPCALISGITGRFFKQFAVTIAASTVISAINALTMTPSRALMIFKKRGESKELAMAGVTVLRDPGEPPGDAVQPPGSGVPDPGHAQGHAQGPMHEREALPWPIFGLCGIFTTHYGAAVLSRLGLALPPSGEEGAFITLNDVILFLPGMLAGLLFGWLFIRPINRFLGWVFRGFNRGFDFMTEIYGRTIGAFLRLSAIVLLAYLGLLFLTYYIFNSAPAGFVPQQDQGRLIVSVQLPDSAALQRTQAVMLEVDRIIRNVPGVAHTVGLCGVSFVEQANAPNFGSFLVILGPFSQRQKPELKAEAIMKKLRRQWAAQIKGARVVVLGASPIPGLSSAGGFRFNVEDRGGLGLPVLQEQSDNLIRKLKQQIADDVKKKKGDDEEDEHQRAMLTGVNTQFRSNTPQLFMDIDRTKVASLGVSLDDLDQSLQINLGSLYVNSFNEYGRYWQVTLQADKQFRARRESIDYFQLRNKQGQMVPLASLVNLREIEGPIFVKRYNLYAAAPISGAIVPGISSGEVIAAVDEISKKTLPRSMKAEWTDLMFMQIHEGNTTAIVFALAVACVFLALSALYESWTLPLAVILVVPLCALCSLIGVLLTKTSVNIFVQIGLVVLIGLACKNAILVVEFAKELHQKGKSVHDATLEAARLRLRPILMTSFAFILGVVPLSVASGAGAEMRRSLGIAVFSGMLGVTMFGIFLTPVFFYVIQGVGETKLFSGVIVQWLVSLFVGAFVGAAFGYMLALLGLAPPLWGSILGGIAGMLAVSAVMGVHKLKTKG